MGFTRKVIISIVVGTTPIVIAGVINLAIGHAALAEKVIDIEKRFLWVVTRIDKRLDRIERKLYEKD